MDGTTKTCKTEFEQAMPHKPWTSDTSVKDFEPLINLIEQHTQSDMFRHEGDKYKANGDYYEMAKGLMEHHKAVGKTTFKNGVTAEIHQIDGWPYEIILEDKAAGVRETVTLNETTHTVESTRAEYCGVSRHRQFTISGEKDRVYSFPGGSVEESGTAAPNLKITAGK